MLDALILTAALALPSDTDTTPSPAHSVSDRQWAANRPNRGAHARTVAHAATIPKSLRGWAACVIRRESGGSIDDWSSGSGARNPASSAQGRFQFLDTSWRRGLSFMVRDRLIQFGMPKSQASKVRHYLASRPIYRWEGVYQQVGFLEVVERGGRFHWNGGSHSC